MADTYRTIDGDTVDKVAFAHYGHHRGTTELLYEANRGLAGYPLSVPAGVTLRLPDLPEEDPIQTVKLYD